MRYALAVASPDERARLETVLARGQWDVDAEIEARRLLTGLGAESYLLAELARYRRRALAALKTVEDMGASTGALRQWLVALHALAT